MTRMKKDATYGKFNEDETAAQELEMLKTNNSGALRPEQDRRVPPGGIIEEEFPEGHRLKDNNGTT